jgi:hypothetical protein
VPKSTPGARKVKEKSAKWYGRVPGSANPVPLCANKTAAQMMLNELVKKAELAKAGISDPYEEPARAELTIDTSVTPLEESVRLIRAAMDGGGS